MASTICPRDCPCSLEWRERGSKQPESSCAAYHTRAQSLAASVRPSSGSKRHASRNRKPDVGHRNSEVAGGNLQHALIGSVTLNVGMIQKTRGGLCSCDEVTSVGASGSTAVSPWAWVCEEGRVVSCAQEVFTGSNARTNHRRRRNRISTSCFPRRKLCF